MTNKKTVDVAILGAGTAGLGARRAAKAAGASVLMIDPGPFGTTCARVGCMPSKLVIAAADAAHHVREAGHFGIHAEAPVVDGPRVLSRVQSERDRFVGFVNEVIEDARKEGELLAERATLVAPGLIKAGDYEISYKQLVVATGGSPFVPPPFRGLEDHMLTNEGIFEMKDLPESMLVVGLGVIGLELGQAFHRLGVRVTLVGVGGAIGPLSDPEVLAEARRVFSEELDIHPEYKLESIEEKDGKVRMRFVDSQGKERDEEFDQILMAAGRRPNLHNIGLENLDIHADERGQYNIDPCTLQLGEHGIFVAGDVNNFHPLLHEAADDGKIAGENAARFPEVRAASRRTPLGIVFSDPQIGMVGMTHAQLDSCAAVAGEIDYGDQGRARVQGINRGKVRIYAEPRSGRLIGAEMFGPRVEHMAHLLAWSVQQGLTVEQALAMPFYHPVVEEGLRTALRDLNANCRRGSRIKCPVEEVGVGA